jgi:hypothetical protein
MGVSVTSGDLFAPIDQRVFLRADWKGLKNLLATRGENAGPRISYLDGVIELMSPAKAHEAIGALIGRLP